MLDTRHSKMTKIRSVPELAVLGESVVSQHILGLTRCKRDHRASGGKSEMGERRFWWKQRAPDF